MSPDKAMGETFAELTARRRDEDTARRRRSDLTATVDARKAEVLRVGTILRSPSCRTDKAGNVTWGSDGVAYSDVYGGGDPVGRQYVVSGGTFPDPVWRPDGKTTCPRCDGSTEIDVGSYYAPEVGPCDNDDCVDGEVPWPLTYLGELAPSHRKALYGFMMRRAETFLAAECESWSYMPGAEWDDMQHAAEQAEEELFRDPWTWLADQPFMRALAALLVGDGNAGVVEAWERRASLEPSEPRDEFGLSQARTRAAVAHVRLYGRRTAARDRAEKQREAAAFAGLSSLGTELP